MTEHIQPDGFIKNNEVRIKSRRLRELFYFGYIFTLHVLYYESEYYAINKNGNKDNIRVEWLKSAYLEENIIFVDFLIKQSNDVIFTNKV